MKKATKKKLPVFAKGGDIDFNMAASLFQQGTGVADTLMSLFEGNSYSKEPLVNAGTMRQMVSPYSGKFAMGGELDLEGMDEETLARLQQMAEEQGVTIEELIAALQNPEEEMMEEEEVEEEEEEEEEEFASGGIIEDDLIKGKVTNKARRDLMKTRVANPYGKYSGIGVDAKPMKTDPTELEAMLNNLEYLKNNWWDTSNTYRPENMHITGDPMAMTPEAAYGGKFGKAVEVEGKEIIETPDGQLSKVKGPKHENGGVDIVLPKGSKVYSDRLKIEGKTMQERKLARERRLAKMEKLLIANPQDKLLKNTNARMSEAIHTEEAEDMALQNTMTAIHNAKSGEFAYGGEPDPNDPDPNDPFGFKKMFQLPLPLPYKGPFLYAPGAGTPVPSRVVAGTPSTPSTLAARPQFKVPSVMGGVPELPEEEEPDMMGEMGAGDYVGLAGNLFNAIAPIINTNANAAGNKPNVNRYLGFGRKAIQTNQEAQNIAGRFKDTTLTDIDTASNSARSRNRNSAMSVNTLRALDATTDMGTAKAKQSANDAFSKTMMSLFGQQGQLETQKDQMEMRGEAMRDLEDKGDRDNYFSNMAQNLTNFGTNIQGIGKALNVSKANRVNAKLISQLSQYGLSFDDDGNLIST